MPSLDEITARNAEIYRLYAVTGLPQRELAERFGLGQGTISSIVQRERHWRAIEGLPPLEANEVVVPPPPPRPMRGERARLVPMRVIGMTHFGPDVEHADPAKAEAERAPLWGGRYPRSPGPARSVLGSPAGACVEEG